MTRATWPGPAGRIAGALGLLALMATLSVAALAVGARPLPLATTLEALLAFDGSTEHRIVWELRLERLLLGLSVGAALGISGAVMQAITRNPLADPGLLGVNAGASLAVVLAISGLGLNSYKDLVWFGMGGAAAVSLAVHRLAGAGGGGASPVRLALAGAAVSALLFALVRLVLLVDGAALDRFRFWSIGSLAGSEAAVLLDLWPFLLAGTGAALLGGTALNALALGEDTARGLGIRTGQARLLAILSVALLTGASVAAVGPLGFIGLVAPHVARACCGPDQRWTMLYAGLIGAAFLVSCDVAGRWLIRPAEIEAGVLAAAVGGIGFILLVRTIRMAPL